MTEAEARAALRAFVGIGSLERWAADQRWEAISNGWRVRERLQGCVIRLEPGAGELRVRHVGARRRADDVDRTGRGRRLGWRKPKPVPR